jgi:hypothetical protein
VGYRIQLTECFPFASHIPFAGGRSSNAPRWYSNTAVLIDGYDQPSWEEGSGANFGSP